MGGNNWYMFWITAKRERVWKNSNCQACVMVPVPSPTKKLESPILMETRQLLLEMITDLCLIFDWQSLRSNIRLFMIMGPISYHKALQNSYVNKRSNSLGSVICEICGIMINSCFYQILIADRWLLYIFTYLEEVTGDVLDNKNLDAEVSSSS